MLLVTTWYLYTTVQVLQYAKKYSEKKSDVAIVLGAGSNNGIASPVFKERLNHSKQLLNSGIVEYIIVTGGFGENQLISDSKAGKDYLVRNGISKDVIFIEDDSKITFYNIVNAKKIMEDNDFSTALLVSDPYHLLRAQKMANKVGIHTLPSPTQTSMYRSKQTKRKFLFNQGFQLLIYKLYGQFRKL